MEVLWTKLVAEMREIGNIYRNFVEKLHREKPLERLRGYVDDDDDNDDNNNNNNNLKKIDKEDENASNRLYNPLMSPGLFFSFVIFLFKYTSPVFKNFHVAYD
jgi:hypothetical protein